MPASTTFLQLSPTIGRLPHFGGSCSLFCSEVGGHRAKPLCGIASMDFLLVLVLLDEMRAEFLEPIQHGDKRFVGRLAAVNRLRLHHHKSPVRSDVILAAADGAAQ